MQQRIMSLFNQIKAKWIALSIQTRVKMSVAAVVFAVALGIAVYLITRPEMVVIDNEMSTQSLSSAVQLLKDNGIAAEVANNTTALSVPKEFVDQARLLLASNNITTSGITYQDALDMTGAGTTEKTRMKMLVLAKQTEIEDSIKLLYSVKSVSVQISMPEENTFLLREQDTPTASVIINPNGEMTRAQAEAIAVHISKSIHNLKLENISIVDTNNKALYQPGPDQSAGYSQRQELELAQKLLIEQEVIKMLEPTYDTVNATAALEWDWTGGNTKQTTYHPQNTETGQGFVTEEIVTESSAENMEQGEEPGAQANNGQQQYPTGTAGQSSATTSSADRKYVFNIVESTEAKPATGRILPEESSLAVSVSINRVYNEDRLKELGELDDTTWEDFKTEIKLNQQTIEVPEQTIDLIRKTTRIENIAVEGLVRPIFEDSEIVVRPINQLLIAGLLLLLIGLLAFGLIRRTQPVEITEIEPELSVEDMLISAVPEEPEVDLQKLAEAANEESVSAIDYFEESEVKKQIDKFIDEKPEAAAQLLRNWLAEEWD